MPRRVSRKELLEGVQSKAARTAAGATAVRGKGNKGVVAVARGFLRELNLRPFGSRDKKAFARALDKATDRLRSALPRSANIGVWRGRC